MELQNRTICHVKAPLMGYDPYLPRPFSISDMDDEKLEIFFQVVGKGTKKTQSAKAR